MTIRNIRRAFQAAMFATFFFGAANGMKERYLQLIILEGMVTMTLIVAEMRSGK